MGSIIKIVCLVLAAAIVIAIVGSIGYLAVKTVLYIVNQHFDIGMAIQWSWSDYLSIFGTAQAEEEEEEEDPNFWEKPYTINENVNIVACTSL